MSEPLEPREPREPPGGPEGDPGPDPPPPSVPETPEPGPAIIDDGDPAPAEDRPGDGGMIGEG